MPQVTQRMHEIWGERSAVTWATQRVVRSMVQWGALADTRDRGVYKRASEQTPVEARSAELLFEALLRHEGRVLPVRRIHRHPALFPFELDIRTHQLRQSPRFEVYREGLDTDMAQ